MDDMNVSVLLFREEDTWIAQGLEYDIAASGNSLATAKEAFAKTFAGQVVVDLSNGDQPLSGFAKAPKNFWDLFSVAERLVGRHPIFVPDVPNLPPAHMIRAMADDLRISA